MSDYGISKIQLGRIAGYVLDALNPVKDEFELEHRLGRLVSIGDGWIEVAQRPSNKGTTALTVSHIVQGVGIPLEAWLNRTLAYTQVIVKTQGMIRNYDHYVDDGVGNIIQYRYFSPPTLARLRQELEELRMLQGKK